MSLQETTLQPAMIASGEAEAGGVLTIDLAAIAANWKRLYGMTRAGRMRRRGQGATPMAAASSGSCRR